jgi:orotidine-5'-phosphate decarboxylase
MAAARAHFGDRLAAAVERKRSQLVVGLDPIPDLLPVEMRGEVARFCCGIVDAVAPYAVAVKPQLAFFEALGASGWLAFREVCGYARRAGLLVIADGKRGDIGSTARAYAAAYLDGDEPLADALTVNPWLGRESIEPYLASARRYGAGIFCVVKTSNAGGDVQDVMLSDGHTMWQHVAGLVAEWGEDLIGECGLSAVGAVVGATHPRAVSEARKLMPQAIMLLPGVGAQGGTPADLARAFTSGPASALVTASRSVIFAFRESDSDFRTAAANEAARLRSEVWAICGW